MAPFNKSQIKSKKASQTHSANAALRHRYAAALISPSTSAPEAVDAATADPRLAPSPRVASTSPTDVSTLYEVDGPSPKHIDSFKLFIFN
jgi:hypothetical protein